MLDTNKSTVNFFKVRLADKNIEIECLHRRIFNQCRDYLTQFDTPDIVIPASQADIDREREISVAEDAVEGRPAADHSDAYLETLAVYRKIAGALLSDGVLLIHGAAIAADGKCYLFMAKSGVGKTTHIKNWLKMIPGTFVVNGDKPLVDTVGHRVFGTPWAGKENMNTNTSVPLGGLIVLERGAVNEITPIPFVEAMPCLIRQTYRPAEETAACQVLQQLGQLQDVPCYRLRCNMESSSALVAYQGITGKQVKLMKLKYTFEIVNMDGAIMAVPVDTSARECHAMIRLNSTAADILAMLKEDTTEDAVVAALLEKYDGDESAIRACVRDTVEQFRKMDILM